MFSITKKLPKKLGHKTIWPSKMRNMVEKHLEVTQRLELSQKKYIYFV